MKPEHYADFRPPPEPSIPWKKVFKQIGYWMIAIVTSFFIGAGAGFWPFFATALAFVFGPKLWKKL